MPRINDILDTLNGMKYFTALDQANAYWTIPISENDREKTAFSSPLGLYEFNYLPFGLTNAPSTFQRLMDILLSGLQWSTCLVYLDDILVFGENHDIMLERLDQILEKLNNAGMKLRLKKCKFSQSEVSYLGHMISNEGIRPDPKKIEALQTIPAPKNVKEVKSFLGIVSYYRRFIHKCAILADPLTRLLKKNTEFVWGPEQCQAFQNLKNLLTEAPILAHPNFEKPFILQTDASGHGIGAVLSQKDENNLDHPIAFASRSLKPAEKNYAITELETLAVVEFVKYFRTYLYQQTVIVETDHSAVKAVLEKENQNPRIARWGLALSGIHLDVRPRKGSANGNADTLSRYPNPTENPTVDIEEIEFSRPENVNTITHTQPQETSSYTNLIEIREAIKHDEFAKIVLTNQSKNFLIDKGLIFKKFKGRKLLYIPEKFRKHIILEYHDQPLSGHFGHRKTTASILEKYYWPSLRRDVETHCKVCDTCQKNKPMNRKNVASLNPIVSRQPFERVGVDCVGPLTRTIRGNRHIVVFVDYFTKFVEAYATPDITAETISKLFVEQIVCRHGSPAILQSDRGTDFTAKLTHEISRLMNTKLVHTSPYHPMGNGEVERTNQTLATRIRMYVQEGHGEWDNQVPFATFAINSHKNESTGFSPFELVYGRLPRLPIDACLSYEKPLHLIDYDNYVVEMQSQFTTAFEQARKSIEKSQTRYKNNYDRKSHDVNYKIGDKILKDIRYYKPGTCPKFSPLFEGPYEIVEVRYPNIVIRKPERPDKLETVHINRTKKYSHSAVIGEEEFGSAEHKTAATSQKHKRRKRTGQDRLHRYYLRPRLCRSRTLGS